MTRQDEPSVEIEDDEEDDLGLPDVYDRPPMWMFFDEGQWDIPENQRGIHAYYSKHGWVRAMAQSGDRVLNFYWHPERAKQDLAPWPGQDHLGRRIVVQGAPTVFGTAHIVPDDWGEDRGEVMVHFGG